MLFRSSTDASTWYADSDSDGYGNASSTTAACSQPTGYVADATDCDDTTASRSPGASEICGDNLDKSSARKRLLAHTWPGNVRELRNVVERLVYLTDGDTVEADDLDFVVAPGGSGPQVSLELSLNDATREFQMQYIQSQIKRLGGNMTEVAKHLGVHRSNLYRKLHQLGCDVSEE